MIEESGRRTKVIKSFDDKVLTAREAQAVAGEEVDVLRLVYSKKSVPAIRDFVRAVRGGQNQSQALLLDISSWTQATIAGLAEPREVHFGDRIELSPVGGSTPLQVKTSMWDRLFVGDSKVYIGPGNVVLRTTGQRSDRVELEVTQGGVIYPEMEVTVPETRKNPERLNIGIPELKELLVEGLDHLLIPGQWSVSKVADFRAELHALLGDLAPWLIVKVDSGEVYERLHELVPVVDGVLISRREMALTLNPATIPMITKEIIQFCNNHAKVVVTASEMLASMRRNVTPTRAEVSDVANAVLDGTDAVVLSEEACSGKYGAKAVEVMDRVICDIEERHNVRPNWIKHAPQVTSEMDAVAYQAYRTAERVKAKAIVTLTKGGNTALKLASFRPPVPIIAVTFSEVVRRRLALVRGVESIRVDVAPQIDDVLPSVSDQIVRSSWLKAGDAIVFVAITLSPVGRESSNILTVQYLS